MGSSLGNRGSMKKIIVIFGVLVLVLLFMGAFISPYTPPTNRSLCRKELYRLREYLLSRDFFGISFFSPEFAGQTNEIEFLVGEFCYKVNEIWCSHTDAVFRVEQSQTGGGRVVVDRWGTPYNFCFIEEAKSNQWDALKRTHTASNIVIWSSGPNKINEYGENDDVSMVNRLYREEDDDGAKDADSTIGPTVAPPIGQR